MDDDTQALDLSALTVLLAAADDAPVVVQCPGCGDRMITGPGVIAAHRVHHG